MGNIRSLGIKIPLEISIYKSLQQLVVFEWDVKTPDIYSTQSHTPYIDINLVFIDELMIRARQLSLCSSVG